MFATKDDKMGFVERNIGSMVDAITEGDTIYDLVDGRRVYADDFRCIMHMNPGIHDSGVKSDLSYEYRDYMFTEISKKRSPETLVQYCRQAVGVIGMDIVEANLAKGMVSTNTQKHILDKKIQNLGLQRHTFNMVAEQLSAKTDTESQL